MTARADSLLPATVVETSTGDGGVANSTSMTLGHDRAGNVLVRATWVDGVASKLETFGYDVLGRRTSQGVGGVSDGASHYVDGRLKWKRFKTGPAGAEFERYVVYSYDNVGRLGEAVAEG